MVKAYEFDEENKNQTFYIADEKGAFGEFQAFKAKLEKAVAEDYKVVVTGKIKKYVKGEKTTIEIEGGQVEVLEGGEEGIENVVLTEKVQKVVVDGVVYIVRDNKLFNLQGAQIR